MMRLVAGFGASACANRSEVTMSGRQKYIMLFGAPGTVGVTLGIANEGKLCGTTHT
jgi:hypothetical protein